MGLRNQIKELDINISSKCRQVDELRIECNASECGISAISDNLNVSRDHLKTKRNNNFLIFDDREYNYKMVIENMRDDNSNYIVVDYDGQYYADTHADFEARAYDVKRINLIDPENSDGYNPFTYITNEVDVDIIVQCIMDNTHSAYAFKTAPVDKLMVRNLEQTFLKILLSCYMKYGTSKTLNAAANLLRNPNREATLDKLFSGQYEQGPKEVECKRFQMFKQDAGERYVDILESCNERLDVFKNERYTTLTKKDSISFEMLYRSKQVLYIMIPSNLKEVELFTSMLISQIAYTLCNESRKHNKDRSIMMFMNYFADAGVIANLHRMMPDFHLYNIGCMLHINNLPRTKQSYIKWEEIFDACDYIIYLGDNDEVTHQYVLENLDQVMIRKKKMLGKEMYYVSAFKEEELKTLDINYSICVVKGVGTFLTPKIGAAFQEVN